MSKYSFTHNIHIFYGTVNENGGANAVAPVEVLGVSCLTVLSCGLS